LLLSGESAMATSKVSGKKFYESPWDVPFARARLYLSGLVGQRSGGDCGANDDAGF